MIKSLLVIVVVIILLYWCQQIAKQPKAKRPKLLFKYGLYISAVAIIVLAAMGKMHWVAAGIAGLLAVGQKLFGFAIQAFPLFRHWQQRQSHQSQQHQSQQQSQPPHHQTAMSVSEALDIFGFKDMNTLDAKQITQRHRELIQKNHPDRGGSDYLAAQINQAKEALMQQIKS